MAMVVAVYKDKSTQHSLVMSQVLLFVAYFRTVKNGL